MPINTFYPSVGINPTYRSYAGVINRCSALDIFSTVNFSDSVFNRRRLTNVYDGSDWGLQIEAAC